MNTCPTTLAIVLASITMGFCIVWSILLPYTYKNSIISFSLLLLGYLIISNPFLVSVLFVVCMTLIVMEGINNPQWHEVLKKNMRNPFIG